VEHLLRATSAVAPRCFSMGIVSSHSHEQLCRPSCCSSNGTRCMDHDFCRVATRGGSDAAVEAHLRLQGHTPRLTALDEELLLAAKEGDAIRAQVAILGGADVQARCQESTALVLSSGPSSITSPGSLQVGRDLTALILAATGGHLDVVWLLLEARARADAAAPDGRQPVHFTATAGRYDVCLALVSAGADASATDHAGRTVLDYLPETVASPERARWQRLPGGQLLSTGLDVEGSKVATDSSRQEEIASEVAAAPLKICSPHQPSEGGSTATHPLSASGSDRANARVNVPHLHMEWLQPLPVSMQRFVDHGPDFDVNSCTESDFTDFMTTDRGTFIDQLTHRSLMSTERLTQRAANLETGNTFANRGLWV